MKMSAMMPAIALEAVYSTYAPNNYQDWVFGPICER